MGGLPIGALYHAHSGCGLPAVESGRKTMIVCKKCGHRNREGESFCASCGAFLEWNSEHVAEPKPVSEPAPAPQPPASSEPTLLERVKHAVGLEDGGDQVGLDAPAHEDNRPAFDSHDGTSLSPSP